MQMPEVSSYRDLIELARREDLGAGDVSSEVTIRKDQLLEDIFQRKEGRSMT